MKSITPVWRKRRRIEINHVTRLFEPFSPENLTRGQIRQRYECRSGDYLPNHRRTAWLPNHTGDWYFTGDYQPWREPSCQSILINFRKNDAERIKATHRQALN